MPGSIHILKVTEKNIIISSEDFQFYNTDKLHKTVKGGHNFLEYYNIIFNDVTFGMFGFIKSDT